MSHPESINKAPGFNFTNNDPYGSSCGNVRIHGYDGNHISLTLDGMSLNDTGNYAINGWGGFLTRRASPPSASTRRSRAIMSAPIFPPPWCGRRRRRDCSCAINQRVADYLLAGAAQVEPLYRLEKAGAFRAPTGEGLRFTSLAVARGAAELRDLIVMAWMDSDNAGVGYPAVKITDLERGKTAAFATFRE